MWDTLYDVARQVFVLCTDPLAVIPATLVVGYSVERRFENLAFCPKMVVCYVTAGLAVASLTRFAVVVLSFDFTSKMVPGIFGDGPRLSVVFDQSLA